MTERWPLSGFGDEVAADMEAQLEVLRTNSVGHLELRSAWGCGVVILDAAQLARAARLLGDFRIGVLAIASPVGKADIEASFEAELSRLRAALDAAERLDTQLVRVFSFYIPQGRHTQYRDEVLRRLSLFAEEARQREVLLVHENESEIYGDTPERCLDLFTAVGSPALRSAFDPANFIQLGVDTMAAWNLLASTVAHVHVKDAVFPDDHGRMRSVRLPGDGDGRLLDLLRGLREAGYRGFLTIEPHLEQQLPELTPPERFAAAVSALKGLVAEVH